MGQRSALKLKQVRDAFRLIGEVRELGHDPQLWRPHMVQGLVSLIGARIGSSVELPLPLNWKEASRGHVTVGFCDEAQRQQWLTASTHNDLGYNPLSSPVAMLRHRSYTHSRQQLVDDPTWYGSKWVNHHPRQMGLDDSLLSHQVLPQFNCIHSIWLHREWGDRLFSAVDVRLLHLFHAELARLWRQNAPANGGHGPLEVHSLPPRLRQTLDGLLQGKSEKQIASGLGLSRHTVHRYVGLLHRRFDVCSNGELLARFLSSTQRLYPRLTSDLTVYGIAPKTVRR
jgi:DNA-binding CsgD family transcriptional regulator